MQYLLMYVGEGAQFQRDKVEASLASIPGVAAMRSQGAVACILECEFSVAGDSTIVRLSEDQETVSVHGTGPAATQFVVDFQRTYSEPLHLIDTDYSFDHVLDGRQSAGDVRRWLEAPS
ncbi:MAG: hypothetical protein WBM96_17100 [Polyangiales bacterium]|jgi:hypothetical protein